MQAQKVKRPHRAPWLDTLLTIILRLAIGLVRCLPHKFTRWIGRSLGRLIYLVMGPHYLGVSRHLRIAFGSTLETHRIQELAKKFWIHFGQTVF